MAWTAANESNQPITSAQTGRAEVVSNKTQPLRRYAIRVAYHDPRQFTPSTVAEVKTLACELPALSRTPLATWSCPESTREAIERGLVMPISASTVRRWLAKEANNLAAADVDLSLLPSSRP